MDAPTISVDGLKKFAAHYKKNPNGKTVMEIFDKFPDLVALHDAFGDAEMLRRINVAISKDTLRPRSMRLIDFVAMPGLDGVTNRFSTFNINLARAVKKHTAGKINTTKLSKTNKAAIRNSYEVITDYKQKWIHTLDAHPKMVKQLREHLRDMPLNKLSDIIKTFLGNMIYLQGLKKRADLNLLIVDDVTQIPKHISHNKSANFWGFYSTGTKTIVLNRATFINKINDDLKTFYIFINAVAHEYGHYIDYEFSDSHGMLGSQILYTEDTINNEYIKDFARYYKTSYYFVSARESSSVDIGDELEFALQEKYKRKSK